MKLIVFGATGMVGQGALREALLAPDVEQVLCVGRSASGHRHPKLRELVHPDLLVEAQLRGYDACLFCLGVSSAGMSEADYTRVTYELTLAAATTLARLNPGMRFLYVSGAGTDERSRTMWARVKGRTENALQALPFRAVYLLRPGAIQPLHGIVSKTAVYRRTYAVAGPLMTALRRLWPQRILSTENLGQAMLQLARGAVPPTASTQGRAVLESADLYALAQTRA